MSTKEKPTIGNNGVERLISELKLICGVYADDVEMIRLGTDGIQGKNLQLLGKKGSENSFQKVMSLMDKISKFKELSKEPIFVKENSLPDEITPDIEDSRPKIKNIQDFHKLKDEQA